MPLRRDPGQTRIPPEELDRRAALYQAGAWGTLLAESCAMARAPTAPSRQLTNAARAARATALAHLGELSAASHALTAEPTAPGTATTSAELTNPAFRPNQPYDIPTPTPAEPPQPIELPMATVLNAVRTARRGAAPGPTGTTNEHLRLLLAEGDDLRLLHAAANRLANAAIPAAVLPVLKLGRLIALRKPNGRVRGLVVGDTFRRVVGRALARHYAEPSQRACLPHQYRSGTEALYKCLQAATQVDPIEQQYCPWTRSEHMTMCREEQC